VARVNHTAKVLTVGFPSLPVTANSLDAAWTAADATNKEQVTHTGREVILARNSGVGARTVTVTSKAINGRTGDVTAYSIGAGETAIFGPYPTRGFRQSDGKLYFEAEHAEVLFLVLKVPAVAG
jgi:hypothetical protein